MPKRSRKNLRKLSRKNSRRISKKLSRKNSLKRKNLRKRNSMKRSRKNKKLRGGSAHLNKLARRRVNEMFKDSDDEEQGIVNLPRTLSADDRSRACQLLKKGKINLDEYYNVTKKSDGSYKVYSLEDGCKNI